MSAFKPLGLLDWDAIEASILASANASAPKANTPTVSSAQGKTHLEQVQSTLNSSGLSESFALEELANVFGMQTLSAEELARFTPDYSWATFVDYQRRQGLLGYIQNAANAGCEEEVRQSPGKLVLITPTVDRLLEQQWFEALIERIAPKTVLRALVSASDFHQLMSSAQQELRAMDTLAIEGEVVGNEERSTTLELSLSQIDATQNPTVKLVDSTLFDALRLGASDIHFEVQQRTMHIKYRLDGVLQSIRVVESLESALQVISRIKVLSDLDISERRIPQDGRFRVIMENREVDFRVSIMPNMTSEDAVLRVLDRKHLTGQFASLTLDTLSFEDGVKRFIRQASRLPYGLLLVTGPTGSGKTTTLYAALSEINTGLDKIVTIEDPIEYQLRDVLQIPVNEKKGLTFAKGLRSILRHDPDKIMVGEIRDSETAHIAVQAALTGHQVFTTVHANNVFDVIGRFSNMGVDIYSLVAALSGIMAQRLVRRLCPHCAQSTEATSEDVAAIREATSTHTSNVTLHKAVGCEHCRDTGYRGRIAIAELLPIDDQLKDLLVQKAPISTLKAAAKEKGYFSLRDSAVRMAMLGRTSMEEVNRVTPIQ